MSSVVRTLRLRRALLSVWDKEGIVPLAQALDRAGVELVATGKTALVLKEAGLRVVQVEELTGNPEVFQGRVKTLSYEILGGILYRRGHPDDESDLIRLEIPPVDCVVVNFYPFEADHTIESIDIGGPTLVRAAAKNSPSVVVLTQPSQYADVIESLDSAKVISIKLVEKCAREAWTQIAKYDHAIAQVFGDHRGIIHLRYGENPHQQARLELAPDSPIDWRHPLTTIEVSYNNILDLSAAYELMSELRSTLPESTQVVIVKHGNPCGVASIPLKEGKDLAQVQRMALQRAWDGDPMSSFGGVVVFSDPLQPESAAWLADHFVELVAAPEWTTESVGLQTLLRKRKNLKALRILDWSGGPQEIRVSVVGGVLTQTPDRRSLEDEPLRTVTHTEFTKDKHPLALFGIAVTRSLKSNAVAFVREMVGMPGSFQLIGAGQGQPNRLDALRQLAVPRAQAVVRASGGNMEDAVLVSDAFFPFRDVVDFAYGVGVRWIVQPGGSLRDSESISACNEHGVAMAFTGVRHFRH